MSKNDIPPRITPSAVPDRLRNDGRWLKETCRPQRAPSEEVSVLTALMSVALVSGKLMPRSLTGLPLAFSRFALVIPLRLAEDVGKYAASLGNWGCPIRRPTVGIATPNRQAYWLVLTRSLGVSR
ncbi:hypothetical protein ELH35_22150 [Rhizobium ruizarguesonis]|uniref:Uncharacterized protein n=1 Tax=Rhizobium ruizarguesonis TaxID=2081791 RepID=A0AAE8Q5A7_9HYPH|nr:hypothetical protein ELH35_22150 [Rhizobium ruizarguesonis]TBF02623.1 hypothetical protein ELG94_37565 [Rhizobium ruizarguesonis]